MNRFHHHRRIVLQSRYVFVNDWKRIYPMAMCDILFAKARPITAALIFRTILSVPAYAGLPKCSAADPGFGMNIASGAPPTLDPFPFTEKLQGRAVCHRYSMSSHTFHSPCLHLNLRVNARFRFQDNTFTTSLCYFIGSKGLLGSFPWKPSRHMSL
jgi:hypothetical protein